MVVYNLEGEKLPSAEEPKFKYDRIGNDVENILQKDSVSCITVHTKFICIGTKKGLIYIFDHEGNTVFLSHDVVGIQSHTAVVNQICVDSKGDNIASCADDGKVLVHGLYTNDNTHCMDVGRKVKCVALDPYYFKSGSGRRFLTGEKKLTLHEKTFLGRIRSTILCEFESSVHALAWYDRFVAWATDLGVCIYDLEARCLVTFIQWNNSSNKNIKDFRCNLLWLPPNTLMIGWVDTIKICAVKKRSDSQTRDKEYLIDLLYTLPTKYFISGLGPFDDQLVVLGVRKEENGKIHRPVLTVADYKDSGELRELCTVQLDFRGFDNYTCNDYHLDTLVEENRFFIVSPKEIVIASPNDIDGKVEWLTENGKFEEALAVLEEVGGKTSKNSVTAVGQLYLDHLISEQCYDSAATLCARICKHNKVLWESQIPKFVKVNRLRAISIYVPKTPEQALNSNLYELIIMEYLKEDPRGFLKIIQTWDPSLYKKEVIVEALLDHLYATKVEKNVYWEALALLYCYQKKYDNALTTYLALRHHDVFKFIKEHSLYNLIHDKILDLMLLDCDETISTLLENKEVRIPVNLIQKQLAEHDEFLFKYLDAYSNIEPGGWDQGILVKLYAKYDKEKLLPFLKSSDNYHIQDALDVCHAKSLYPEMVFLQARIGNTRDSLRIIIEQLQDINQAINFCQEHNDEELWMHLIRTAGNYVDPRVLIENMKPGCEVRNLKDALGKMMCSYRLQLSVQQACKKVTLHNYFDMHEKVVIGQRRGISVTDELMCSVCRGRIIDNDMSNVSDLMVFNCRHCFHIKCLPKGIQCQNCAVCAAESMRQFTNDLI